MSRSEMNAHGSTRERGCWSDRVVDEAHLVPVGTGLGNQKTAAKTPKSLWLCIFCGTHGKRNKLLVDMPGFHTLLC